MALLCHGHAISARDNSVTPVFLAQVHLDSAHGVGGKGMLLALGGNMAVSRC